MEETNLGGQARLSEHRSLLASRQWWKITEEISGDVTWIKFNKHLAHHQQAAKQSNRREQYQHRVQW